jgi:DNA-binding transcriptional MerR regulator
MLDGCKTIGEVAKETGLSVREIKYYSERGIIAPSEVRTQGNKKTNLYSSEDIIKIQQIALYRELGYSNDKVKEIISDPNFRWKEALDSQVKELRKLKKHIENRIIAAEFMRMILHDDEIKDFDISDFDISYFNNDIDLFMTDVFSPEGEENTEVALMKTSGDFLNSVSIESLEDIGKASIETYKKFISLMDKDPKSDIVQNEFINIKNKIKEVMKKTNLLDSDYSDSELFIVLFALRFLSTLSIERFVDMILQKENALEFIEQMIEEHMSRLKENENG